MSATGAAGLLGIESANYVRAAASAHLVAHAENRALYKPVRALVNPRLCIRAKLITYNI
jgi:hypothetical protein